MIHRRKNCPTPRGGAASPSQHRCRWCGQRWQLVFVALAGWRYMRAEQEDQS